MQPMARSMPIFNFTHLILAGDRILTFLRAEAAGVLQSTTHIHCTFLANSFLPIALLLVTCALHLSAEQVAALRKPGLRRAVRWGMAAKGAGMFERAQAGTDESEAAGKRGEARWRARPTQPCRRTGWAVGMLDVLDARAIGNTVSEAEFDAGVIIEIVIRQELGSRVKNGVRESGKMLIAARK